MKIILLSLAVLTLQLTGCGDYVNSSERAEYKKFVEHCKVQPESEGCKAWKDFHNSPGN